MRARAGPAVLRTPELAIYGALLLYFAVRVTWFALRIHPYVPPDEVTHIGRVLAYTSTLGVPADGPTTWHYGLVDHRPWLYYWVVARALALNFLPAPDLVFARLVNGLLGLGTVVVGLAWVREWCGSVWARVLFAILVTNTLMFTGLSGGVSYDNGANLMAAGSVLALTRYRLRRDAVWLLALVALVCAGCLVKRTLLPLGFLLAAWLLVRERGRLRTLGSDAASWLRSGGAGSRALGAAALVLVLLTGSLYGGNLVRYGSLRPGFDQVVGESNAMRNRVFARSRILERFRAGEIPIAEAKRQAERIRHAGDRGDTLVLLKAAQVPASSLLGPIPYAGEWAFNVLSTSIGYLGHRRALHDDAVVWGYASIFALAGVGFLWGWRPGASAGVPGDAAVLAFGYAMILMWLVSYPTYQTSRYLDLGLQGRYIFPVLVPIYGLVAYGIGELTSPKLRPVLVAAVAAWYLYGDFPWFLQQLDEKWFAPAGSFGALG